MIAWEIKFERAKKIHTLITVHNTSFEPSETFELKRNELFAAAHTHTHITSTLFSLCFSVFLFLFVSCTRSVNEMHQPKQFALCNCTAVAAKPSFQRNHHSVSNLIWPNLNISNVHLDKRYFAICYASLFFQAFLKWLLLLVKERLLFCVWSFLIGFSRLVPNKIYDRPDSSDGESD